MGRTCMPSLPDKSTELYRPTFAEIDLDAYSRNIAAVQGRLPVGSRIIAVVKAGGYGHGTVELARRCAVGGVAMVAVALLEEAIEISSARIDIPILILGALTPPQIEVAARSGYAMAVVGPESLRDVCDVSARTGRRCKVHLNLDSGMGRVGLIRDDLDAAAELLSRSPEVEVAAIFSHYATASRADHPLTARQRSVFESMLATLRARGVSAPLHHMAASAGVMRGLVEPGEFVRVGLLLLGAESLDDGHSRLEPVLSWRSRIARLKRLGPGNFIGYGASFETRRDSLIATIPVGYADGYDRMLSNRGEVLIRGRRAPVAGRVSMDLINVDVTGIEGVQFGDSVTLLGRDGDDEISADELAEKLGTIPYEVFCRLSARVPRLYRSGSQRWVSSKFNT